MISIKNLNFYYETRHVLKDINIEFEGHQVYTLIGPSGSGKSTLLRVLNRMDALHEKQSATGEVLVEGENIFKKEISLQTLRARVGMVFQKPTPFALSIFDNIAFALNLHRKLSKEELKPEVERLLNEVGLFEEVKSNLKRSAFALSGGQQQRLCLARTLATQPKILLLDEPTSSLDPASTARIETLVKKLAKDYLIIMVTHNLAQAKRLGNYTLFMRDGCIIEMNQTQQFFDHPQNQQTQDYLNFT